MSALLPIFLKLQGRPVLMVGAGNVALEKIESLLVTGAHLRVVAPRALPRVLELAAAGSLQFKQRGFVPDDLEGSFLVIAATDAPDLNHEVYRLAGERGILANAVDDPPFCDFYFGSVVRRGALQIGISTSGESPAVAQMLRREIDAALPADFGHWLADLGELRREVLHLHPPTGLRKQLLHMLAQREVCSAATCPSRQLAQAPLPVAEEVLA